MKTFAMRPDLHAILLDQSSQLIDVRAPEEFAKGALPNSINLPILNDEERARVGKCYRSNGQQAAIALGHKLVTHDLRAVRIADWVNAINEGARNIYCWRGGMRSQLAEQWLAEQGVQINRIDGGFKALRNACIDQLDFFSTQGDWLLIGGRTGSGKTEVLRELGDTIDLEGIAHHRGSAFGGYPDGQPTPISFENELAIASLQHIQQASTPAGQANYRVVLEDEGSTIGRLGLPISWHQRMQHSPILILEVERDKRVENILQEYVGDDTQSQELANRYDDALSRISRRLGGDQTVKIRQALLEAFTTGEADAHRRWIEKLLIHYYDPMYDYQIARKQERILLRGSVNELQAHLAQ